MMRKDELFKNAIKTNIPSKEKILKNILNKIKEEELRSSFDFELIILMLIARKDMYGYKIIEEMEVKRKKVFKLREGEIYPILHKLENKNYIDSYWKIENGINKKYYKITRDGLVKLEKQKEKVEVIKEKQSYINLEVALCL